MPRSMLFVATALGLVALASAATAQDDGPPARRCRVFPQALDAANVLDTTDATSAPGAWVQEQAALGWRVAEVDFEVGQKSNGYPQGWAHVCLSR